MPSSSIFIKFNCDSLVKIKDMFYEGRVYVIMCRYT